jgi:hypothetical protein
VVDDGDVVEQLLSPMDRRRIGPLAGQEERPQVGHVCHRTEGGKG